MKSSSLDFFVQPLILMRLADADLWETAIELQGRPCAAGLVEDRMILKEVKSDGQGTGNLLRRAMGWTTVLRKTDRDSAAGNFPR